MATRMIIVRVRREARILTTQEKDYVEANAVRLTAEVWREAGEDAYTSLCPELDIASMGDTPEEAVAMLRKAVELYLEEEPGALDSIERREVSYFDIKAA